MAVQDDEEELRVHVRVKIKPGVTENFARVDVLADATLVHALAIADVLNHAAQKDARLADMDVSVKFNK
jgi:hypothetical protein